MGSFQLHGDVNDYAPPPATMGYTRGAMKTFTPGGSEYVAGSSRKRVHPLVDFWLLVSSMARLCGLH